MTPHSLGTSQLEMSLAIGGKYNNLELLPNSGDDAGLPDPIFPLACQMSSHYFPVPKVGASTTVPSSRRKAMCAVAKAPNPGASTTDWSAFFKSFLYLMQKNTSVEAFWESFLYLSLDMKTRSHIRNVLLQRFVVRFPSGEGCLASPLSLQCLLPPYPCFVLQIEILNVSFIEDLGLILICLGVK